MGTFFVGTIIFIAFALSTQHIYKNSSKGPSCSGCTGCPSLNNCSKDFSG